MNINQVLLYGNVCTDVERKEIGSVALFKFNIAVDNSMRKANGELKKDTLFIGCMSWNEKQVAGLKKGSRVFVGGRLKLETWEKDGKKFSKHLIVCDVVMSQEPATENAAQQSITSDSKMHKLDQMINNLPNTKQKPEPAFIDDLPF